MRVWARVSSVGRVGAALGVVFVLAAAFYLWIAGTSNPFTFDHGGVDRYNLLANAFLHLRLSIGRAPAGLLHLAEPYNPEQNASFLNAGVDDAARLNDDLLYGGYLYFLWGPAPALVLLVPLHLLGLEPSASVTVACFAILGLGFALGTLRVLLRQIGDPTLWMCVLAASALALCTAMPFLLRTPSVTEDTLAGGFCFMMAGIWLAAAAIADGRSSPRRLVLMSLCFGLAAGSRPPLALAAVALVPVYLSLRSTRPRRRLLTALIVPIGVCLLLLLAYNQARFGDLLEFGKRYQLAGYDSLTAHLTGFSYVPPGAWFYALSPPRLAALFPFIVLDSPPLSYPVGLPAAYIPEITGGLLPMTPILAFLLALPWIWRRRPTWLGSLGGLMVVLAGAGIAILLLLSYENFGTTERYEVEFSAPLLLGALAAWLALSCRARVGLRRLARIGGGLLVVWGCATGFAISFVGYGNLLAAEHPGTWSELQDIGSPLSAAIVRAAGHPVLVEVFTKGVAESTPASYTSLQTRGERAFWFGVEEQPPITIVSPAAGAGTLVMEMSAGLESSSTIAPGGGTVGVTFLGPKQAPTTYAIPPGMRVYRIPLRLGPGINRFELRPVPGTFVLPNPSNPTTKSLVMVTKLSFTSR
jgi:hypothetical protein